MRKDESQIKQNWNKDWADINLKYHFWTRKHSQLVRQYLRGSILDVGCGPGYLAAEVQPNEGWYTGVDISDVAIKLGQQLFPGAHFFVGDVSLPGVLKRMFQPASFDTVVVSEVLEHIENFEHIIAEARIVSREYMLFSVPISMGGVGHVWPEWSYDDVERIFKPHGTLLEIRRSMDANSNIIWMRR